MIVRPGITVIVSTGSHKFNVTDAILPLCTALASGSVEAEQSRTVKDGDNLDGIGPQAVHDSVVALNDLADGFVTQCSSSRVTAVKMRSASSSAR